MAKPVLSRCVVIGVDLGATTASRDSSSRERLIRFLLDRFDSHQLQATWATADLSGTSVETIRSRSIRHEIALSTPLEGSSVSAVRSQLRQAESLQIRVQSYALDPRQAAPLELLSRAGIRSLRPTRVQSSLQAVGVQPQTMRFGMWGLNVSAFLPHSNRIADHFLLRQLMLGLRLAMQQERAFHLVLDVPALAAQGSSGERTVDRLLSYLQQFRQTGELTTARLMDVDRSLQKTMSAQPARSILRRAA